VLGTDAYVYLCILQRSRGRKPMEKGRRICNRGIPGKTDQC
jgi:hypothetical protein